MENKIEWVVVLSFLVPGLGQIGRFRLIIGYFWFLADSIRFNGILEQYREYPLIYYPLRIIEYPFTSLIFPFILFHLDFLDRERKWTLGYLIEATK